MKNRKKVIVVLISAFLPLLLVLGLATWIILDKTIFAPRYNPNSNSILYNAFEGQSTNYNGSEQGPTSVVSTIDNENVSFSYRLSDSIGAYKKGLPTNAGTYDILVKDNNDVYIDDVIRFTINKIEPLELVAPSLEKTTIYEGDNINFTGGSATGINNKTLQGSFEYTNTLGTAALEYIGTANTCDTEVSVTFYPSGDDATNYLEKSITIPISMSAVAYIIGSPNIFYGTIEKALTAAISGDIVTVVPPTKSNYHESSNPIIPDNISYTIRSNCEIKSGVSFIIPTDNDTLSVVTNNSTLNTFISSMDTDDRSRGNTNSYNLFATQNESKYLRVSINIAENKVLTNNGNLIISGYLSGGTSGACTMGQTSHSYSRILLGSNSQIVQNNENSNIYCYGYIQEQAQNNLSKVTIDRGNLYIPFIVDDYKGFQFSWAMTDGAIDNERCSPFNQFEMRNIDSNIQINYNAKVYGMINVWVTYSTLGVDQVFTKTLNVLGNNDTFFFQLTDSIYSSVNYKFDRITEISKVKIYGGMSLNNFQLKLEATGLTVNLSTTNAFFPFSYRMDVELFACEGQSIANFDVTKQRIKLLPGANFTINDKCLLKTNELIVYSAFYDGSIGNGQNSQIGSSKSYPLKKGATLKLLDSGKIEATSLAGTIYGDVTNITYSTDTITSKEAWSIGSSGKLTPAWNIKDYLEIREKLNICPLEYLDTKVSLYVGVNTFTNYNSYVPAFNVLINDGSDFATINGYQQVLFFDSLNDYQFEFVSNIYKAYYNSKVYQKEQMITYNETNSIVGVINSVLSISNNNNGINEFNVQRVDVSCITPPVNGQIPLYVNKTISLEAEVIDITKAYNKTIIWESLDTSIATVDNKGNVTGVALGKTIIQAICDGVIGTYEVEVIEEIAVDNIESVYITDNNGNSSEKVAGSDKFGGSTSIDYHGAYSNNKQIVFTININPSTAPYSSIEWTLNASAAGRQWINDNTQIVNTEKNVTSVTVNTGSGTGASADKATLKCVVTGLDGAKYTATFTINHKADTTCLVEGTLITMANGTQKKVEDLKVGDMVLVFNHETGKWDYAPILVNAHKNDEKFFARIINLQFDDGTILKIVGDHGLFDLELNEYIYITEDNVKKYYNHRFVSTTGAGETKYITLINSYITEEYVNVYSPASVWHLNLVTENLLTLSSGMVNFFEYDENLKYDEEMMQKDIEQYGLYTYDDFKDYISIEIFNAFPFKYFKIAVGKGLTTYEWILELINYYYDAQ